MDKETSIFLGKILGEIYRMQRDSDGSPCAATDGHIYALRNGFEHAVKEEIERIGFVSDVDLKSVMDVLDPIFLDDKKLKEFKGFYDVENSFKARNIDRSTAIVVLRYLYANGQYVEIIDKMDSSDSPAECRRFKLDKWD